mmetsp:Transcript_53956/g.153906  ORF Transcript_53956/g.153906 Transcript_53956/m.153906 type:complete len:223 (+) Transcript_53956:406-1074(+)
MFAFTRRRDSRKMSDTKRFSRSRGISHSGTGRPILTAATMSVQSGRLSFLEQKIVLGVPVSRTTPRLVGGTLKPSNSVTPSGGLFSVMSTPPRDHGLLPSESRTSLLRDRVIAEQNLVNGAPFGHTAKSRASNSSTLNGRRAGDNCEWMNAGLHSLGLPDVDFKDVQSLMFSFPHSSASQLKATNWLSLRGKPRHSDDTTSCALGPLASRSESLANRSLISS